MTAKLRIDQIKLDGGTQPRAAIDQNAVRDYAEALQNDAQFPPVTVFYDGNEYWLADGFHRLNAHKYLDWLEIDADVKQGTQKDAQWYSLSANQMHGLRRSRADVERAIKFALLHPEIIPTGENSDRGIARHIGCDNKTVARYRAEIMPSEEIPQMERTVVRNGTTYTQKTDNIGKRPASAPEPAPLIVDAEPLLPPIEDDMPFMDMETGEILEPAPTYPPEMLEAAHKPMAATPYQPVSAEFAAAATTVEELRGLLGKLLSYKGRVTADTFADAGLTGGAVANLAFYAHRMLGEWLTPAEQRDAYTLDAEVSA